MGVRPVKKIYLRSLAIGVLTLIGIIFLSTVAFVGQRMGYGGQLFVTEGQVSLRDYAIFNKPMQLNGWWDSFEGVVCNSRQDIEALGEGHTQMRFPIGSILDAKINATYRLRFQLPEGAQEDLVLYIPNFSKSADIYLNGVKQGYWQEGQSWLSYSPVESVIKLNNLLPNDQWQELVISGAFEQLPTTLYKRSVILGTMRNVVALAMFSSSNELFLFGMLLLTMLNAYVFMLFRPEHKIISLMTLFDSMILMRAALAMNHVSAFAKEIVPWLPVSDRATASVTLFFLMLGGIVGCKLSAQLYDPEGKVPRWMIRPLPWIYGAFAIVMPNAPQLFNRYGRYMLIVVYGATFIGVFWQYKISRRDPSRRTYRLLQFIKTVYIGGLIFFDILLWNTSTDFLLLCYLYCGFFVMHVIVRLYDNNESYREVEVLNESLEDTVRQRTKQLSDANRILAELSTKDSLTQIFNRLYFEQAMERTVAQFEAVAPVHLCMFDLDLFKQINDQYGHPAGDEQLRTTAQLVGEVVGEQAMFARIGGEEFVLLFATIPREAVMDCVQRVHATIAADARGNKAHTTASFGVAAFETNDTAKQLMKRTDVAMYEAKHRGRNCIVTNFDGALLRVEPAQ